ncbi:glyceraldehyde 3-phosphate dehydrogenase NAD-binding domain-containing protein [Oricola cellulosilytica]|uniref:Uncharacterized protein n=1 Tax=Oricola cellulosilytica TaxID=1429082 RepID=A0A4R0P6D9_9HYPH|nr:glyceraldehyde 3-phosphate dehydrogenase NAD-binding domain-containing protein [Oricola cellulosilytica]TCD12289.1 hypothetical protein E0D97_14810 [Oricola cellulosilytica]
MARKPITVAINGFGRIGRTILRQLVAGNLPTDIRLLRHFLPQVGDRITGSLRVTTPVFRRLTRPYNCPSLRAKIVLPETMQADGHQVHVFGWYDNEWGFSSRMIDVARMMAARKF